MNFGKRRGELMYWPARIFNTIWLKISLRFGWTGYKKPELERKTLAVPESGFRPRWIVIHHSAGNGSWAAIRAYHMSWRYNDEIVTHEEANHLVAQGKKVLAPWRDIGYHLGAERRDGKWVACIGRPLTEEGAHALGFNDKSIGICLVGNYDVGPPDPAALDLLAGMVRNLQREFRIPRDQVIGHRETYEKLGKPVAKTCPGTFFSMDELRAKVIA